MLSTMASLRHLTTPINLLTIQRSFLHLSCCMQQKCAGRYKASINRDFPLTYEQANKPDMIGVRKSWNSLNTSTHSGATRKPETAIEDILIRKFIHGTWPRMLASEVIIKRRANSISVSFMATRMLNPQKMYFLIGYTEEILSLLLKCIVKVELQTVESHTDMVYKYI